MVIDYLMDNKKALLLGALAGAVGAYIYHSRQKPKAPIVTSKGVEIGSIESAYPPAIFYPQPGSGDGVVIWIQEPEKAPAKK